MQGDDSYLRSAIKCAVVQQTPTHPGSPLSVISMTTCHPLTTKLFHSRSIHIYDETFSEQMALNGPTSAGVSFSSRFLFYFTASFILTSPSAYVTRHLQRQRFF